jgi:NitT/TauT family transport system substrate-binding protein/sulfonate transport system substrate-binding protein
MNARNRIAVMSVSLAALLGTGCATTPEPPVAMEAVIGNNFGHLPMFVGVEKGLFKKHGIDLKLKVVNTGTDMVGAMTKREVQIGDMSVTTFLKARHAGSPFLVVGMIMNDANNTFADSPLAIVARKGSGITRVEDLKGKRIGLAKEQTSDEYLKMVLARRGMNYGEMNIQSIMAPPALVKAFAAGKIDAMVSWEPFNTMGLMSAPESYEVLRGGGHLSYMMIATVHDPMVQDNPRLIQAFVNGLAAASHYTRQNRDEAVAIFAKWVPNVNLDVARKAIQHINYDPRISRQSLQAFENAQKELLQLTIKSAKPIPIASIVLTSYTEAAERAHPEYFSDLPAVR